MYTKYIFSFLGAIALLLSSCQQKKQEEYWITTPVTQNDLSMAISASGTLKATNTVEVGTQVSGVINEVLVDFNDKVKAGQIIARLDDRMLQAALQQAEAAVSQAELQLSQRQRAYQDAQRYNAGTEADLSVIEAEASRQQVKTQLDLAQRNFERYQNLYNKGAASRLEFESKQMEYERLQANYDAATAMVDRSKANLSSVDLRQSLEQLKMAEANLQSARANRQQAAINLGNTEIRSPIDGIILSRTVENGQTVAASFQTPILFTIAKDLTQMEIEASIDESDIGFIQLGQPVNYTVDAYADKDFSGKVQEIRLQPQVISNVVIYTVVINTDNPNQHLLPGMTANLDIITNEANDALLVPVTALSFQPPAPVLANWQEYLQHNTPPQQAQDSNGDTGWLWLLNGQEEIRPVQAKITLNNGRQVAIESDDITPKDLVVTGLQETSTKRRGKEKAKSPFMPTLPGQNSK